MNDLLLEFLGRLHMVAVHFPIALLWVAGFAELVHRGQGRSPVGFTCVGFAALSAVVAAALGWIHADVEPPSRSQSDLLLIHRWVGVGASVFAVSAFAVACGARDGKRVGLYRGLLLVAVTLVSVGGHLGGSLIHGDGYLTRPLFELIEGDDPPPPKRGIPASEETEAEPTTPEEPAPPVESETEVDPATVVESDGDAPTETTEPEVAEDIVEPVEEVTPPPTPPVAEPELPASFVPVLAIFEASCYECHGERKVRGNLRLDDLAEHFSRDELDWVIVPGDPDASLVYERITLPEDDGDLMPPEEGPLTAEEIEAIRAWIEEGAPYEAEPSTPSGSAE